MIRLIGYAGIKMINNKIDNAEMLRDPMKGCEINAGLPFGFTDRCAKCRPFLLS
jgi:hypothetical protein